MSSWSWDIKRHVVTSLSHNAVERSLFTCAICLFLLFIFLQLLSILHLLLRQSLSLLLLSSLLLSSLLLSLLLLSLLTLPLSFSLPPLCCYRLFLCLFVLLPVYQPFSLPVILSVCLFILLPFWLLEIKNLNNVYLPYPSLLTTIHDSESPSLDSDSYLSVRLCVWVCLSVGH